MMQSNLRSLLILGGGTAGWLTALFLKKVYPDNNITLVEDPSRPPIIAGESGGLSLSLFYRYLNIDINQWVLKTNALPKLGGKFYNWNGLDSQFTHGSIDRGYDKNYSSNHPSFLGVNREFILCALAEDISMENLFYNSKLINSNSLPINLINTGLDTLMWHFDSQANANFLKNIGISRGINFLERAYICSSKFDNGDIKSLHFSNGTFAEADWFFDCTGFSRLLIEKDLQTEFLNLSNLFPARSVIAWWGKNTKFINHTCIHAMKYGWSWNINLYNRSGNGYVYDHDLIDENSVIDEINTTFKISVDPVAKFAFEPSISRTPWKNNVIGIGLSSGFIEPLESNGLSQVILQLELLERYWNPNSDSDIEKKLYNQYFNHLSDEIINFLLLHYKGHRRDTDFWKSHAYDSFRTTEILKERLSGWRNGAMLDDVLNLNIYSFESYATVIQGLNLINKDKLKIRLSSKRKNVFDDFKKSYNHLQSFIDHTSRESLSLESWINLVYKNNLNQNLL